MEHCTKRLATAGIQCKCHSQTRSSLALGWVLLVLRVAAVVCHGLHGASCEPHCKHISPLLFGTVQGRFVMWLIGWGILM